jgi:inosose dehydratase
MSSIQLAGGPVSWGVDFADAPGNPPYAAVLDGIAAAGLTWLELGPVGYVPPAEVVRRGLATVGTFVFDDFHRADVDVAPALDAIAAAGGRFVVLIDRPCEVRAATAGRSELAPRLDAGAWAPMVDRLRGAAETAAARGIRAVFHPHAGSYVEFEDEIERLLADTEIGLCLDTGHALYAHADPAALIRRHGDRLEHLHLKDVVAERRGSFWDSVAAGVFCPVGDGLLDLAAVREALTAVGYDGFATVEQDRRPGSPGAPEADLRRSVARLRAAGIG